MYQQQGEVEKKRCVLTIVCTMDTFGSQKRRTCLDVEEETKGCQYPNHLVGDDVEPDNGEDEGEGHHDCQHGPVGRLAGPQQHRHQH